ncbi:c-type cytochrome [Halomonas heilongjiangensis]|uniref:cytochrome-c oxidase n=1 Tax=Halomonas heilongjiangensis TaxID=1387883 RepID=A0A2N7TRH9_9GAMM|nr:c-type cytochrome [Halomonas heilongjiangensis]PMR70802.1 cytochrome-c oxidase [Halomonas heilongjiangensis]PXX94021.1 cytochrome-c oxidase [Halomonas heilongjiangensis]
MAIAIAVIVLALGSILFFFFSPWSLTPLASNWGAIDDTIHITLWVTGAVFVAVNLFLAYVIIRYRYHKQRRSHYEPENKKLEAWLTGLTTIGIAGLLAPGLLVWGSFVSPPEEAHEVEVVGQQWHWSFRFPGEDGRFGAVHNRHISDDNPFGMIDDPAGQDDVLVESPRLVLPVDRPVRMVLRSKDVLHNFKVANFRAKMDMLPGQTSYFWFTPTEVGEYEIVCAQLCGIAHFAMRGRVEVVEEEAFEEWLAGQPTHAELAAREPPDPQAGEGHYATCAACHGREGQGNPDLNAPKLAGLEGWYLERQLELFRNGARGTHDDDTFGQQMRPFAASLPDRQAVTDIAAYIEALPDEPVEASLTGNAERGARLYRTCGSCHGNEGQGIRATNAPRLAGMPDWYLARQLQNFREGVRGRHSEDPYGNQMVDMAQMLVNEQAVDDVVAYIMTLPRAGQVLAAVNPSGEEE